MEGIMIAGTLPAEGWVPEKPLGLTFNVATVDSVYSNSHAYKLTLKELGFWRMTLKILKQLKIDDWRN